MVATKQLVLDIAMNLTRIGNWAADGKGTTHKRISTFLNQTNEYVDAVRKRNLSSSFKRTFDEFHQVFRQLCKSSPITSIDRDIWAESLMTWGNILTHRAKFLDEIPHD